MTNEQTPFETVYYVEESNKIHVTELFDISDCEDSSLQTAAERELNQMLEFDIDDWGDADFGGGGDQGWDKDFNSDDDLFPPEEGEERGSFIQSREVDAETFKDDVLPPQQARVKDGADEGEEEEDENDVEPYFFSDMASKALNMSQEYNEMLFGTFRHMAAEDEEEYPGGNIFSDTSKVEVSLETLDKIGNI